MLSVLYLAAVAAAPDLPPVPDPASIVVPDVVADSRPLGNEKKFFIFHRTGATFEEAVADFRFCFRFANQAMWSAPPDFVPWFEDREFKAGYRPSPYGLVGDVMGSLVEGGLERSIRQINMTSCMLPRGYARYRISEELWQELNKKDIAQAALVQAKIAIGPTPKTPRVLP